VLKRWLGDVKESEFDTIEGNHNPVIIAGFGRVGQIVGRMLTLRHIPFTALERSPEQVDIVRRFGNRVYYGEPARLDLLRAAHADKAKMFVLAIDNAEDSLKIAQVVRRHFPQLDIYATARDRFHALRLLDVGVKYFVRETFHSSLKLSEVVLQGLGDSQERAMETVSVFAAFDEELLQKQQAVQHDESKLIQSAKEARAELQSLLESGVDGEIRIS